MEQEPPAHVSPHVRYETGPGLWAEQNATEELFCVTISADDGLVAAGRQLDVTIFRQLPSSVKIAVEGCARRRLNIIAVKTR